MRRPWAEHWTLFWTCHACNFPCSSFICMPTVNKHCNVSSVIRFLNKETYSKNSCCLDFTKLKQTQILVSKVFTAAPYTEHLIQQHPEQCHRGSPRGTDLRTPAVHLQRPDGGDQHHHVGPQTRVPALDVEELLHADVCAEPGLRHCGAGNDAAWVVERPELQVRSGSYTRCKAQRKSCRSLPLAAAVVVVKGGGSSAALWIYGSTVRPFGDS